MAEAIQTVVVEMVVPTALCRVSRKPAYREYKNVYLALCISHAFWRGSLAHPVQLLIALPGRSDQVLGKEWHIAYDGASCLKLRVGTLGICHESL